MDPCTSAFSFVSRVSRVEDSQAFPGVVRMETIGHLYHAHPFAFSATSFGGRLALTFFWDPAQLNDEDSLRLSRCLERAAGEGVPNEKSGSPAHE